MSHAHSKIELRISCENLPYSSSNQVIMFVKDSQTQQWISTSHKTEVINSSNPEFITSMIVDYHFAEVQQLRFICVNTHGDIGHYDCSLGSLFSVSSHNKKQFKNGEMKGKLSSDSNDESHNAHIIISAEEFIGSKNTVTLQIKPHNDINTNIADIAMSDQAFLVLSRANEDGTYSPVHKNQNISLTDESWPIIEIEESKLCNSDKHREFKIEIKNDEGVLGECSAALDDLLEKNDGENNDNGFKPFSFRLPNEVNTTRCLDIKATLKPTFLGYIANGTQINLVIAIDFTESNGDPKDRNSLHYTEDKNENDYQRAIRSVGTILEQYDSDKKFPVYGFGAKFNGELSHEYPLNNNFANPEVCGVDGVMKVYQETINNVELRGPTNFAPVIKQTTKMIKSEIETNRDVYYILLIITDGIISDMNTTIRSIVKAKNLPLSIIIVGVGNANFEKMKILDADDKDKPLTMFNAQLRHEMKGKDIVQFVAMREFKSEVDSTELLAKKVMEEIPNQFMTYMSDMEEYYKE